MDAGKLQEKHHRTGLTRRRFSAALCLGAGAALTTALNGCGGTSGDAPTSGAAQPGTTTTPTSGTTQPATTTPPTGSATGVSAAPPPSSAPAPAWTVADAGALALQPGASFDLAGTLPPGVARGGAFAVDPSGAPLPAGVTLLTSGLLTAAESAAGMTSGVVFRYTPPA